MPTVQLEDRDVIEAWLRRDPTMHLYELGDLDDFFWPYTTFYGLVSESDSIRAVALVYSRSSLPVVLVLGREDQAAAARALLTELRPRLPARFYAHLIPGIIENLPGVAHLEQHGRHDRMVLLHPSNVERVDTSDAHPLSPADTEELDAFYKRAYPGNWFDPRMLDTGAYVGIRRGRPGRARETGRELTTTPLVSVAGVHVLSRRYRVAALGNIATDPAVRGLGLARVATAAVCKALGETHLVGLNVESTNAAAIAVYTRLGFERVASYDEVLVTLNRPSSDPPSSRARS
jgi:ribosomal protein S18 acetylase RimI-like enzyme